MTNNLELNEQCCCCQETLLNDANICILTCKHKFHLTCILKVRNNQCPLCRELLLPENELPPNDDENEESVYDDESETDEYETITDDDYAMSIVEETIEELSDDDDGNNESNEQTSFDDELKDRIHFVIIKTKKCINMLQDYYSTKGVFTKFCINEQEQQEEDNNDTNEKQFIFNLNMLCECISKFICSYKFKYFDKMYYFVDYFCKIAELNKSSKIELFIEQITQLKSCYEYLEELLTVEVEMDIVEEEEEKTNTNE